MSLYNSPINRRVPNTTNMAGGSAYSMSPELEAITLVLTSFVQDTFYSTAQQDLSRLKDLTDKIDPEFMAKLAIFARKRFGMRSISHALAANLAKHLSGKPYAKSFYEKVINRPDDITETLSFYLANCGTSIPNAMRKGFKSAIEKFDDYTLAKYRAENKALKMVDVVNLLHPKSESVGKLVAGTLKNTETWEAKLSSKDGGSKEEKWAELLREGKLGYLALIRNIRNILEADSSLSKLLADQLVNEKAIRGSKVMPFQIFQAYEIAKNLNTREAREVCIALSEALDLSCGNVVFDGVTAIYLDQSGSMSGNSIKYGSIFAAVLAKSNNADIVCFWSNSIDFNYAAESVISLAEKLNNAHLGGTSFSSPLFHSRDAGKKYDRIIILSDMQSWIWETQQAFASYKYTTGADPYLYGFDLNWHGTMQFPENKVFTIAWFHWEILKIMETLEQDKNALINEIKATAL